MLAFAFVPVFKEDLIGDENACFVRIDVIQVDAAALVPMVRRVGKRCAAGWDDAGDDRKDQAARFKERIRLRSLAVK